MKIAWKSNEQNNASIPLAIECEGSKKFRIFAHDYNHNYSYYVDRWVIVDGKKDDIFLSFPTTPLGMVLGVTDLNNASANNFKAEFGKPESLRRYDIWSPPDVLKFASLAQRFSEQCGYNVPPKSGTLYSEDEFNIKYVPIIVDGKGAPINTPARVGHRTGLIEVAANSFMRYTVPMRVMILLHEFSHKYRNPVYGFDINNEFGADIFGLYIFLGLGYSKIDAICVFNKVFLTAQTPQNTARSKNINEYIARYEAGEFAKPI